MSRKKYSDETRAAVVAALLEGQSINKVAKDYKVPKGTVSYWKKNWKGSVNPTQKNGIGDLVLKYLENSLEALSVQVKSFQNREWLLKQNAADLAVLHGVMTDKAIRLLEAMSAQDNPED